MADLGTTTSGAARSVAIVHGVPLGAGGLGLQAANVVAALGTPGTDLHVFGPGPARWTRTAPPPAAGWHEPPRRTRSRFRLQVFRQPAIDQALADVATGLWAAREIDRLRPSLCYAFTHVAFETLRFARTAGIPTILDSPTGHIRNFRNVYVREAERWCGGRWLGYPPPAIVERVEEEYRLADRIRVSSKWARESLVEGGVPEAKIAVLEQGIDLARYQPAANPRGCHGPLHVVSVGTLDLRKGFVYLLKAVRALATKVSLELVGGTVDRHTRRLLERERAGLAVACAPADPRAAYHRADLSAVATLEDGQPFVAAEAMASGLPLIVTSCCGARDWVEPERTGWIVPPASVEAIVAALGEALQRRERLAVMGRDARLAMERRLDPVRCDARLAEWVSAIW